jgi:molybdenum cofactor cytidylyltransferase
MNEGCAILILAAGGSKRLGSPKQLLQFEGKTFIRGVANTALSSDVGPCVVVLGAQATRIQQELQDLPLHCVINESWQDGMASSIRVGMAAIEHTAPQVSGVILVLSDQPRLSTAHLTALREAQRQSGHTLLAYDYGTHRGPPAYFGAEYFVQLMQLEGDQGARQLLQTDRCATLPLDPALGADIDTAADYQRLLELPPL